MFEYIVYGIIAGIIGLLLPKVSGFKIDGCGVSFILGFIGAYVGTILAREFNFPDIWSFEIRGITYPIIWSIIGALIVNIFLNLIFSKIKMSSK